MDLTLNNLQILICHQTKPEQRRVVSVSYFPASVYFTCVQTNDLYQKGIVTLTDKNMYKLFVLDWNT